MRLAVMLLSAALVGYAIGHAGRDPSPQRASRVGVEATSPGFVAPARAPAGAGAFPEEAWRRMVEEVPCPPPPEEAGRIRGFVRDRAGEPLAGAVVTAVPDWPQGSAVDLALRARRYVSMSKWEALSERRAVTGADGFYEIRGVGDVFHEMSASLAGYSTGRRWNVHPGAIEDFHLSPVVALDVRVLLPDGCAAPFAWLHLSRSGTRLGRPWSPAMGAREVEPGTWWLKATHPVLRTLASPAVEVVATWGESQAPVVLYLAERPAIRGTLRLATGLVPRSGRLYLLPWREPRQPTPGALAAADANGGTAAELEDARDGTFGFYDLDPGAYWIAASVPGGDIEACTLVEVRGGIAEVRLVVTGDRKPEPPGALAVLDDITWDGEEE